MSRLPLVVLGLAMAAVSSCHACSRTEPPAPAKQPAQETPRLTLDPLKAADAMQEMFSLTTGDCKPGTGPASLEGQQDSFQHARPPCEYTAQYHTRMDALKRKAAGK
jgi:hypothetical protein